PCTIHNALNHWPALSDRPWSLESLRAVIGHRWIPVEIGSKYTDDNWSQKVMLGRVFMDRYVFGLENIDKESKPIAYLAQHNLFRQIPELYNDIATPDFCHMTDSDSDPTPSIWLGPAGTISPLHTDPRHNIFTQIIGRKYIRLYAPTETENVYPHIEKMLQNTSQVDVESPDLEHHPKFKNAKYIECIVRPGDCLFIPKGWWHYVRSLDSSCSISFWF
ncbi:Clavaminate synthase-like protein, partial [Rhizoclosmatium globosum]